MIKYQLLISAAKQIRESQHLSIKISITDICYNFFQRILVFKE